MTDQVRPGIRMDAMNAALWLQQQAYSLLFPEHDENPLTDREQEQLRKALNLIEEYAKDLPEIAQAASHLAFFDDDVISSSGRWDMGVALGRAVGHLAASFRSEIEKDEQELGS